MKLMQQSVSKAKLLCWWRKHTNPPCCAKLRVRDALPVIYSGDEVLGDHVSRFGDPRTTSQSLVRAPCFCMTTSELPLQKNKSYIYNIDLKVRYAVSGGRNYSRETSLLSVFDTKQTNSLCFHDSYVEDPATFLPSNSVFL